MKPQFYWVHSVIVYPNGALERSKIPTIGKLEHDGTWSIVGSDYIFETYTSLDKLERGETYIIPVKEVEQKLIVVNNVMVPEGMTVGEFVSKFSN